MIVVLAAQSVFAPVAASIVAGHDPAQQHDCAEMAADSDDCPCCTDGLQEAAGCHTNCVASAAIPVASWDLPAALPACFFTAVSEPPPSCISIPPTPPPIA